MQRRCVSTDFLKERMNIDRFQGWNSGATNKVNIYDKVFLGINSDAAEDIKPR